MEDQNTIWLYGVIGSDEEVTAKGVRDELAKFNRFEPVTVRINSPGGVVSEAVSIHTMLTQWLAGVDIQVDGIAASAASYLTTVGRHVAIARDGMIMIHNPYGATLGDAEDHRGTASRLDLITDSLIKAYVSKTKQSRDEIRKLMAAETWFTADGAVAFGLADSIIGEEKKSKTPRLDLAEARLALMESDRRVAALVAAMR